MSTLQKIENHRNFKLEKSINIIRKIKGTERNNLSKSIVIHHSKNANLIQSVGRYADLLNKDNDDEYGGKIT